MSLVRNPLFAWYFARAGARNEERGNRELRVEMLAGLAGRVVEVGAGTGLNFPHYPPEVREVVAVEPEPYLRERAAEAAASAPVPVKVVDGMADRLPVDEPVDAVVVSGVLCSVADPHAALAEFHRVLRPGGELRFYEHVRSHDPLFAGVQRAAAPAWARLMGGCRCDQDTLPEIRRVFTVERVRGFRFPYGSRIWPAAPRIHGAARKPG